MAADLTGHVIVITGASSGIGAAAAIACAEAGMDVVLNARRAEKLEAVADEIRRRGGRAALVVGDVAEQGVSARMLDVAEHRFGRFDAVFANAGYGLDLPVIDTTEEQLRKIFEVNFFAGVDLLREAAQRWLAARRRGHLLMCSSCVAKFTLPYYSAYSATKAAQNHICRAMRLELEPHGIHVASVHPI
ncbi:MAG: SDR family NAD(P)-dependent oxidoreductase, partial [Planctomycetota bacterium]